MNDRRWKIVAKSSKASAGPMERDHAEKLIADGHLARAWGELELVEVAEPPALEDVLKAYANLWQLLHTITEEERSMTADEAATFYTGQPEDVWAELGRRGLVPEGVHWRKDEDR